MTHYERLGVAPDATPEEIRQAYRARALEKHPDMRRGSVEEIRQANREFGELSNAYRAIINPEKRAAYDISLRQPQEPSRPVTPKRESSTTRKRRKSSQIDLRPYYEEIDAIQQEIWNAPRNEFIRETLMHAGFLVLCIPLYIALLRTAFGGLQNGAGDLRLLIDSVTVPLLGLWSLWQISVRVRRIRAGGGLLRFFRKRHNRRTRPRRGTALELGMVPLVLLAFGFLDAVSIALNNRFGSPGQGGLVLSIVPLLALAWIVWRSLRRLSGPKLQSARQPRGGRAARPSPQ